jgi:hypothetical protein
MPDGAGSGLGSMNSLYCAQRKLSDGAEQAPATICKDGRLTKKKAAPRTPAMPTALDQARDELFSHILRCGVLEAAVEHQKEWMDDTMQYIGERYALSPEELVQVRALGDRFCQPVVKRAPSVAAEPEAVEVNS